MMKRKNKQKKIKKQRLKNAWTKLSQAIQRFREWQKKPYEVAPMADKEHVCATCQTNFTGNYCPRCGQSARIGRYSLKTAILNFMDVWGLGNRGMFRTLRDLILRPGYMIRDFLSGMQMAYYPPFKMFFLLTALSILVTHSLNIKGENLDQDEELLSTEEIAITETKQVEKNAKYITTDKKARLNEYARKTKELNKLIFSEIEDFTIRFPSITTLLLLILMSGTMYFFFRNCPNIPDLRYSELFVALLYSVNMYSIYAIVLSFLALPKLASYTIILTLIPMKQFSGFSWWRTIWSSAISFITQLLLIILLVMLYILFITVYMRITV